MGKIALAAIGRLENAYAPEWVEHHLKLGFDKVIICDNNRDGEERFEDVLGERVREGRVVVRDFRNIEKAQRPAYTNTYLHYGWEYDWIAFFDFDEFLCIHPSLPQDVHALMERYGRQFQVVMVPWLTYTDSGLVLNDGRPVRERFTEVNLSESTAGKGVVRGGITGLRYKPSVHLPGCPALRCCDTRGREVPQNRHTEMNTDVAWLAHYTTKTIEEYLSNKARKGTAGRTYARFLETYGDYFFQVNKRTPEKEAFIERWNREHGL